MGVDRVALVPVEAWAYQSPLLKASGADIDIGLLAESLVYFDRVYVSCNEEQFAKVAAWFAKQGHFETLVSLVAEGSITPYYYAFITSSIHDQSENVWSIWNIQDEAAQAGPVFLERLAGAPTWKSIHPRNRRSRLEAALRDHHLEVKADEFGNAIENARKDYETPERSAAIVQMFVDEVYPKLGYLHPPEIKASHANAADRTTITWNFDFTRVPQLLGKRVGFHTGTPLVAAAVGTRTLWSAATLGADLYLGAPMTTFARYKLHDSWRAVRRREIIGDLVARVAFPDVRELVNDGRLPFSEVLKLRKEAFRFRRWLETESTYDRDAVIAYHSEVAAAAGFHKGISKLLSLSGMFGGAALGAALGGPIGAVPGALTGASLQFLLDLGAKLTGGWKPIVYGEWARARVERAVRDSQ